jgi:hypothetical protein
LVVVQKEVEELPLVVVQKEMEELPLLLRSSIM